MSHYPEDCSELESTDSLDNTYQYAKNLRVHRLHTFL